MKTDVITVNSMGHGFEMAAQETRKAAAYRDLAPKDSMCLQLCTEEMLSLVRSITGGLQAFFWVESEANNFELHLSAKTDMNKEKRALLISSSTSRKNEAAVSFLGKIRNAFETLMLADENHGDHLSVDILADIANHPIESEAEWDGYESSILKKVSDQVKVSIQGDQVNLTVCKHFM